MINVKMPTIVGILTFMSRLNFMLSWDEHEIFFITSGPDFTEGRMNLPREAIGCTWVQFDILTQLLLEGVHTSISKETYSHLWFFRVGGELPNPCTPSGSIHAKLCLNVSMLKKFVFQVLLFLEDLINITILYIVDVLKYQTLVVWQKTWTNSKDPDQTQLEAVWSWSSLFFILTSIFENYSPDS